MLSQNGAKSNILNKYVIYFYYGSLSDLLIYIKINI